MDKPADLTQKLLIGLRVLRSCKFARCLIQGLRVREDLAEQNGCRIVHEVRLAGRRVKQHDGIFKACPEQFIPGHGPPTNGRDRWRCQFDQMSVITMRPANEAQAALDTKTPLLRDLSRQ